MEEGMINLRRYGGKVDYIITHTAPYEVLIALGKDIADEEEEFVHYLENISSEVSFKNGILDIYILMKKLMIISAFMIKL